VLTGRGAEGDHVVDDARVDDDLLDGALHLYEGRAVDDRLERLLFSGAARSRRSTTSASSAALR